MSQDPVSTTTSGTTTTYARTLGGSPLGQKVGSGAASYYLRDPHGDTVGVVSTAAANQGTTAFDPYGRPLGVSGTQPWFGYQSDPTDALTKQVDMGTRWYAPSTGRFSTQDVVFGDPLHPISLNQWVYGAANPITMWDPTGMNPCDTSRGRCVHSRFGSSTDQDTTVADANDSYSTWEASSDWDPAPPAPPPPEPPVPSPTVIGLIIDHAPEGNTWIGRGIDAAEAATQAEAAYLAQASGLGFLENPASRLYLAKSSFFRGAARSLRSASYVTLGIGAIFDYSEFKESGDTALVAGVKTVGVTSATLAGTWAGGQAAAGGCLATVILAPVAWACGLVGAGFGGYVANKAAKGVVDLVDFEN